MPLKQANFPRHTGDKDQRREEIIIGSGEDDMIFSVDSLDTTTAACLLPPPLAYSFVTCRRCPPPIINRLLSP